MRLSIALHALVLALVALVYAPAINAAPVDVSAAADGVLDQLLVVSLVGTAVLLVIGAIAALGYVLGVMGASAGLSAADTSRDLAPHVRGYVDQQSYLDALASRLAAEDASAASLVPTYREATLEEQASWDRINDAADLRESRRSEAEASGSDMALYDKYVADDATHEEAMRWSDKAANAAVKVPTLGAGWSSSGEIKMPVLGPGWK